MALLRALKYHMKYRRERLIILFLTIFFLLFLFRRTLFIASRDFFYVTRPIWDTETEIGNRIPHFYAPNIPTENLCKFHNWTVRGNKPRVIDAFIFSIELDMLEIRLKELWNVVDQFVLIESDRTFTGSKKPLVFMENKERFSWAEEKLAHFIVTDLSPNPSKEFENEAKTRGSMQDYIRTLRLSMDDLVIVGDIDELPYPHTIQLLKTCQGYPTELHLELRNYIYSFEFRLKSTHWRQHITTYKYSTSFKYHHGRRKVHGKEVRIQILADAGWHCSFCFRFISEFIFKMTSYSHNDRVTRTELLEKESIQRKICEGADIFDMLPEAYSFQDLVAQWGKAPKTDSTVGIPDYIVQNSERFKYLLPGGCLRNDSNSD